MATTTFEKNICLDESAAERLANMLDEAPVGERLRLYSVELLKGKELDTWFSCNFPNSSNETGNPDL